MSQLISDFIIEPVVRQARRFSRRDSTNTAASATVQATSTSATDFPNYVDPISGEAAVDQEEGVNILTERLRSIPRLDDLEDDDPNRDRAETDPEVLRRQEERQRQQRASDVTRERFMSANASFPARVNEAGFRFMEQRTMSTTSTATRTSQGTSVGETKLPADDGMHHMRRRILDIQNSDTSVDEKSRQIHRIMLEQYLSTSGSATLRAQSPSSLKSGDRPITPISEATDLARIDSPGTSASLVTDELLVTTDDIKPTYWIMPPPPEDATPGQSRKNSVDEDRQFGCEHYKRNVKLQCSACHKWYTCRFCHDKVEDHNLSRRATKHMLCMNCGTAQSAAADCTTCGSCAAHYYCKICKLWDDDSTKSIYHCDSCGICRRGEGLGRDFFHCQKCSACISIKLLDNHKCIERSTDCDCPICGEYMFTSPKTVVFMKCGHSIHYICWGEHMKNSYKCPICSKSMVNMDLTFRQYDNDIEMQPMPEQFRDTKAWIFCNDCANKSLVPFHWIGLKCVTCDSYNTIRLQMLSAPANMDLGEPEIDHPAPAQPVVIAANPTPRDSSIARTAPVVVPGASSNHPRHSRPRNDTTATDVDAMDTADEEDDVDFWGGTSPRERAMLEAEMRAAEVDSDSDESTDQEIDPMDEDEDEGEDAMAIFGHR